MFTLTLKELAGRKLRLLTTAFAVLLGVAFMAGTMVFTETIGATFDSVLAEADDGVDAYIRAPSEIDIGYGEPGPRLDAAIAGTVAEVPGVDEVALRINGYAQLVGRDGETVGDITQNPAFGTNWVTVDELNPYELTQGHAPTSDDEIVIDKASADSAGYAPGDVASVLTQREPRRFTIVGIATFGSADSPAGATAVLFTDAVAAELLASPGEADAVAVTIDDGADQAQVVSAIGSAVGPALEVVTGDELIAENQAALSSDLASFDTMMMIFAVVAMFVGAFIINNTFSITVAQRTREMAMLRAIGASGRQVKRSVLVEAVAIGVVASAAGLVAGIGVATGLRTLMTSFGITLPPGSLVVPGSSLAIAFGVGVAVTVLSAWLPARKAARVAPIEALREVSVDRSAGSGKRAAIGAVVTAAGIATLLAGLSGELLFVGVGAMTVFVGVSILGPVLARPVARLFGVPLRMRGLRGELATRNAMRNPKRMARTASSLMIGVGLVGFITVFAASVKASVEGSLATEFTGTHIVTAGGFDNSSGLSASLAGDMRDARGVDVVAQARLSPAIVDGHATDALYAFDATTIDQLFALGSIEGDLDDLGPDGIAISSEHAAEQGWTLGSVVPVTFPSGDATFVVEAIYPDGTDWVGSQFLDLDALRANGGEELDYRVYVSGDADAVRTVAAGYASADVQDREAFLDSVNADIDTILGLFYALLALAVVIALLGIANTLALSVFERTRELGLLRAIGMSRSQVRSMVRWESIVIAVFGAVLGLGVGSFFGWAIVRAMADQGIDTLTIPAADLAAVAAIAAVAGAVAAVLPARRAANLDVLDAVTRD